MKKPFQRLAIWIMTGVAISSAWAVQDAWASHVVRLLMLPSTELLGQPIDRSNPVFTCEPGRTLSGTIAIHAENDSTVAAPIEGTLTWQDHEQSWHYFDSIAPADTTDFSFSFEDLTVPSTAGTYYMVIGASPVRDGGFVVSMTSGSCAAPVWNDGNDLADQNETTLAGCLTQGWATLPLWKCDHFANESVGITYIKLIIEDLPVGACCLGQESWQCHVTTESVCTEEGGTFQGLGTNCDINPCNPNPVQIFPADGGNLNGQVIDVNNPVVTFEPGQPITGTVAVQVYNHTLVDVSLEGLSSWQDHETKWGNMGNAAPGHNQYVFPIGDLNAAVMPGDYYMIVGSIPGPENGYIASMTSPACGSPVWNDGNDLADQNETTLAGCMQNGYAMLDQWQCDHMQSVSVGISYVKVVVQSIPAGACCVGQNPPDCYVTTSHVCTTGGGTYLGDGTGCDPNPCQTPTKHTTWGRIRGMYK